MKISTNGHVFEFGFKVGLARALAERNHDFKEEWQRELSDVLESARTNSKELGYVGELLGSVEPEVLIVPALRLEKRRKRRRKRSEEERKGLIERLRERGLEPSSRDERVQLGVYAVGLYMGEFFGRFYFPEDAHVYPFVFGLFEERREEAGVHLNADMILEAHFPEEGRKPELHVYDLKLYGGTSHLRRMLTGVREGKESQFFVPPRTRGVQLSLSMGDASLGTFTKALVEVARTVGKEDVEIDFEVRSLVQVFSYLFDYFKEKGERVKEFGKVHVGLIASTTDSLIYTFDLSNGVDVDVEETSRVLRELYKELKKKDDPAVMKTQSKLLDPEDLWIVEDRLREKREELEKEIEELERDLKERSEKEITERIIPQTSISALREDTYRRVKEFWESGPFGRALVLLHSTGAGKTTAVRKVVLEEGRDKVVYLYFAPRIKLLEAEKNNVASIKHRDVAIVFPYENEEERKKGEGAEERIKRAGEIAKDASSTAEGIVQRAVGELCNAIREGKEVIACFLTTHSVTRRSSQSESTLENHFGEQLRGICSKGYKVVIVLDELTGSNNGFFALKEALSFVGDPEFKDDVSLFVFDATLHSKGVFERAWREYRENGYVAPCLFFSEFERDGEVNLDGVRASVYSGYSYPAKEIVLKERFVLAEEDEKIYDEVAEIVLKEFEELKKRGERLYLYVQDREAVQEVAWRLKGEGVKVFVSTSNLRGTQTVLEGDRFDYDVVVSTSTLSRGISLRHNFTKVVSFVTHFFSVEENIAEDIQAIARIRGMEREEEVVKEVVRVYGIRQRTKDEVLSDIAEWWIETFFELRGDGAYGEEQEEEDYKAVLSELKKTLWTVFRAEILKDVLTFADVMRLLYRSYYFPEKEVVVALSKQTDPIYTPENLSPAGSFVSFLKEFAEYRYLNGDIDGKARADILWMASLIKESLATSMEVKPDEKFGIGRRVDFVPPFVYADVKLEVDVDEKKRRRVKKLLRDHGEKFFEQNPRIAERMIEWLLSTAGGKRVHFVPALIYLPSLAIAYELADESFVSIPLVLSKYVTRFSLSVVGAELGLKAHVRRDEGTNGVRAVAFPVESGEGFAWLKGSYPKIRGDLLKAMLEEKIGWR